MRKEYDFSKIAKEPHKAKMLKKQISIRLETEVIGPFKKMAAVSGIFLSYP